MTLSYLREQHSSRAAARGLGPRILSQVALVRMGRRTFLTALHRGVIGIVCDNRLGSICRCVRVYLRRRQFWSPRFARPPGRKYRPRSAQPAQTEAPPAAATPAPQQRPSGEAPATTSPASPNPSRGGAALPTIQVTSQRKKPPAAPHPQPPPKRRLRLLLLLRHRPSRPALPMSREEPRLCRRWRAR